MPKQKKDDTHVNMRPYTSQPIKLRFTDSPLAETESRFPLIAGWLGRRPPVTKATAKTSRDPDGR